MNKYSIHGLLKTLKNKTSHLLALHLIVIETYNTCKWLQMHLWENTVRNKLILNKTGNVRINITLRRFCITTVAVEKQYLLTLSDCVSVALHAMHMCHILLSVACLAVPYFSTLSHHATLLGRKLLNIKCVLIFSKTFLWNISHYKNWERYKCT